MFGRDNGGRSGGLPFKFIIALIIGGVALFNYYRRTEVNPVTGEKQRIALNTEQEISLGLRAAPQMAAQMGGVISKSNPRAALVNSVGRAVVERSDAKKSPYKYDFHLLNDSQTLNAFALPGGQIFITKGLFDKLETEAQLAGVLGHEIGHVINRHAAEHMATGQLGQSIAVAVGVAGSGEGGRGITAQMAAQAANQMLQLKYGRNDESEADTFGLQYMAQAGYDPSAMLGVMKFWPKPAKADSRK